MGANKERGEVDILLDGKPITLRLEMNALCVLETRTGLTYGALVRKMGESSFVAVRDFMHALLQPYHAAEFPTLESVGKFIDRVGMNTCAEKVRELVELNDSRTEAANPPTAGTGTDTSLRAVG